MAAVVLLGTFQAQPGRRDELIELLRSSLPLFRANEPGLEMALFHHSPTDADQVVAYERYASPEAFAQHRANYNAIPAYAEFRRQFDALLAAPVDVQSLKLAGGFASAMPAI